MQKSPCQSEMTVWLCALGRSVSGGDGRRGHSGSALTWADVDLANGTATIRASLDNSRSTLGPTKTRRVRVVDIPDDVVRVLAEHRKRQRASERYVFGHDGRAYRPRTYRSWLDVRCRAAGVPSLPVHSLRHTCASLALDAGVPVQDVARQLGHSVQTTQKVYAHFIGQGQRRAANALGAAFRHRFSGPKPLDGTRMAPG